MERTTTLEQEGNDYNPLLNEAPIQKEYQKANLNAQNIPTEIPEPTFEKPTIDFSLEGINSEEPNIEEKISENDSQENNKSESFNPQFNDLSKKDKRISAELMADTAIGGYEFIINNLLVPVAKIKEQKVEEKILNKEINPNITFVVDAENNRANVREYVSVYNETVDDALEVTDAFKNTIREPLIRIAEKRGIGMTDEQFVALELGKDLLSKGIIVFQLKKSTNMILNMLEAETAKSAVQYPEQPKNQEPKPIETTKTENSEVKQTAVKNEKKKSDPIESKIEENSNRTMDNIHSIVKEDQSVKKMGNSLAGFGDNELLNKMNEIADNEVKSTPKISTNRKHTNKTTESKTPTTKVTRTKSNDKK